MTTPSVSQRDRQVLEAFARRINRGDPGAQNDLGVLYVLRGLVEQAIAAFTRALDLDSILHVAQRNLE
ncbi:MAG: tetratricopeptide repeat protein, partial [Gemmatimonadetes bacterium]|nr:tetratricopeptide repeat protein [Gemmatimonadota bacterium]